MGAIAPGLATVPLTDDLGISPTTRVVPDTTIVEPVSERELPELEMPDDLRNEIALWIGDEINKAKSERQEVEEKWKLIQVLYEMTELTDKDFPFEDSSHLVIPIIATFTETVWAKIVNTIFAPADPFAAKPLRAEFIEAAKALRKFLTWSSKEELDLESVCSSMFLELVKLGTCVAKVVYAVEEREMFVYDPKTREYTQTTVRLKDNPEIIHVPLADFYFRLGNKSQDDCTWKSHRFTLSWGEILRRRADGRFKAEYVDKFLANWRENKVKDAKPKQPAGTPATRTPFEAARDDVSGEMPLSNDEFEFHEIWFEYIVHTKHKLPIRLVAWYEPNSGALLNIKHNWYPLQDDPFEVCPYIPREHRIYGIGVGNMAMPFQNEITAMHNQRLDNATVANANVTFVKDDSTTPLNFRVKPGGTYAVDDPNSVKVMPMGQKYDSTINEEQHTLSMVQQRVGIQDYIQQQTGQTSTQAIINMQEATRKFDIVIRNIRRFMSRIMEKVMLLYQQHYPDGKTVLVLGPDGDYIEQLWQMPQKSIKYGVAIQVTATTSTTSKELERQTKLSLFNMMTQYYGQLTQYVMQANNPQMPPVVQQTMLIIVEALGMLVNSILEDFDEPNADRLVVNEDSRREFAAANPGGGAGQPPQPPVPGGQAPAGGGGAAPGSLDGLNSRVAAVQQLLASQGAGR